ncbi:MAG: LpxI family protein [Rickettsiaceae bacterium]
MLSTLGIIAGSGDLPYELAKIHAAKGGKYIVASIDKNNDTWPFAVQHFDIGKVSAILEYFQQHQVQEIILVGGISRPNLTSINVDKAGSVIIAKILKNKFLGDDNVLQTISAYLESKGFKVISPKDILQGNYQDITTTASPSPKESVDIELGKKVLNALGLVDVGQSIIACNAYVLGIEAAEGTDNLIRRCSVLRKQPTGGVLIKMSKLSQDMRLDVPVIGPETITLLAKFGFQGVAIEKTGVIIIKPEETAKLLHEHGLFLRYL